MLAKSRHSEWQWDYTEQKYYHIFCDSFAAGYKCPICDLTTPDSFTWGDILEFIRQKGCDRDEYFHFARYDVEDLVDCQVWNDSIWQIAVYWVKGDSEGWYVHIDEVYSRCSTRKLILLGKFWDTDRAAAACRDVTEFIYNH